MMTGWAIWWPLGLAGAIMLADWAGVVVSARLLRAIEVARGRLQQALADADAVQAARLAEIRRATALHDSAWRACREAKDRMDVAQARLEGLMGQLHGRAGAAEAGGNVVVLPVKTLDEVAREGCERSE